MPRRGRVRRPRAAPNVSASAPGARRASPSKRPWSAWVARPQRTRAALLVPLAVAAVAILAASCGSDEDPVTPEAEAGAAAAGAEPLGEETAGSVAQLAQC